MQKSLLIAVRDTTSCSQGVRFVGSFFKNYSNLTVSLFYVITETSAWESLDDPWAEKKDDITTLPAEIKKVFALCSNALQKKGFPEGQLKKIAKKKRRDTVEDITNELQNELHDAVILGKRSSSFLEDLICGNKGHALLDKDLAAPVWFCRDPAEGLQNVLLCLDGSPVGQRIADHVGFILQGEEQHSVTLLHVDRGQPDVDPATSFLAAAAALKSHGIPETRIHTCQVKSSRVTNAILKVAEEGKFAVIALGSVGRTAKKGVYDKLIGSTCKNIFDEIDKTTLWIVP